MPATPRGHPLSPLFWLVGLLSASYAVVALVRLSSKRMMGRISLNARYRAKVWGFERLLDSSLTWHQQESTGNKAQRLLTGAEAVREWTDNVLIDFLNTVAVVCGFAGRGHPAASGIHPVLRVLHRHPDRHRTSTFDRRIDRLSDRINKSLENASGGFVESASNILSVKALGAAGSMTSNLAQREELARRLSYERLRLGNTKWMCYQIHNGVSWGIYLLVDRVHGHRGQTVGRLFPDLCHVLRQAARDRDGVHRSLPVDDRAQIQPRPDDAAVLDRQPTAHGQAGSFRSTGRASIFAMPSFITTTNRPSVLFRSK